MASQLDEIRNYYSRLSTRDRNLLTLMIGAVALFAIFLISTSIGRATSKRADRIEVKTQELKEVAQLTQGYRQAESERKEIETRLRDHAVRKLFSYLEDLGKKDGLDIGGMNDKGSAPVGDSKDSKIMQQSVDVTLTHVELAKLTKFLNDVETNPGVVRVTRLQIRPRQDDAVLDAYFTVSTYYLGS